MPKPPQRRPPDVEPPTNKALQWQDMPKVAQRDIAAQVAPLGMAKSRSAEMYAGQAAVAAKETNKPKTRLKAQQRMGTIEALAPHFKDEPITLRKAANARVGLVKKGAERTKTEGTSMNADWYFQHNKKLQGVAHATGHDADKVIAASAVMSPQNNPEQELRAVTALAIGHSNPNAGITVTQQAADAAAKAGIHGLHEYVGGGKFHPSKFTAEHLAGLSTVGVREHVQAQGINLEHVAQGGVKGNVEQAIDVLRGKIDVGDAINPRTSPKVWSYHENIAKSKWGSPEHEEFNRRMQAATGAIHRPEMEGQQSLGPMYPELKQATHGPLNPTGHTAEDTWQQAISTRQPLPVVDIPGRSGRAGKQSPAKFSVGEGGSANQKELRVPEGMSNVGNSATMHAFQNKATQMAAAQLSKESEEIIPTMGIQAPGWTEARRTAGKNIEEMAPLVQPHAPAPQLFNEDLTISKKATVTPNQLKKGHQKALASNQATAKAMKGKRGEGAARQRAAAAEGISRNKEFLGTLF